MDTTDPDIYFDSEGICNHCHRYKDILNARTSDDDNKSFDEQINKIKKRGLGSDYDCIVGISGGVDSSYLLQTALKNNLRVLAVHVDNGWDSELAVYNIRKLVESTGVEYITHILDWKEFRDLQVAFLKGDTPDGEIPTDHAIDATLWRLADKHRVKTILSGMNFQTEAISVPGWAYGHSDYTYIQDVYKKNTNKKLKSFPYYTLSYLWYLTYIKGIRIVSLLNYTNYNKEIAKEELIKEIHWRPYDGKHYESIYTRFYLGYILPTKFDIDLRKGHLSDLINSGQTTRSEALSELTQPPLPADLVNKDTKYLLEKFELEKEEFNEILKSKPKTFRDYANNYHWVQFARNTVNVLRRFNLYPK